MKVIPVIDILNGLAVHAVRGERRKYQPLESVLCPSANPVDIARTFKSLGFDELYVADLDAILGKHTNFTIYKKIKSATNLDLMVDAGINAIEKAWRVLEAGVSHIIVGTETLVDLDFIGQALKSLHRDRVIISIDLKGGKVLSRSEAVRSRDPASLAETFGKMGVIKIIVLDLSRVGAERGVNLAIVQQVLKKTGAEVLAGGGIRGVADLEGLRNAGVAAALVATALHKGELTMEDLKSRGFL